MEMKEKYYTPNLEEFHVGFEYEFDNNKNPFKQLRTDQWIKCFIKDDTEFEGLKNYLTIDAIKVKYLDKEDIEELGWRQSDYNEFKLNKFELRICHDRIDIYEEYPLKHECLIFRGNIKNKSELKKLMKQLNIEK